MHVLVVSKVTALEWCQKNGNATNCTQEESLNTRHNGHHDFLKRLSRELEEHGIKADYAREDSLETINAKTYDVIISCGGDGTFLTLAQTFPDTTLLGINSDKTDSPKHGSIGALASVTYENLGTSIAKLKGNRYKIEEWPRLYASINGTRLKTLATNEIYLGPLISYQTCHFNLRWHTHEEHFKGSSGLIVTTGIGSTAWYLNEGGTPFTNELLAFGFLVRAPNLKRQPNFTQGMVPHNYELTIVPHDDGYVLSFDSKPHKITLKRNDTLAIGLSREHPVRVIRFSE